MERSSVGLADVRALAGDLLVKTGVLVVALVTTVVALSVAQITAGWIVGRLASAWPVVDPATAPFPVASVAVATVVVVGLAAATILLPALAPFVAVAVVDPLLVQRVLGYAPADGEEQARPAARPYLQWGQAGVTAGLLVVGVGITVLYWVPVLPETVVPDAAARVAALLPSGLVSRPVTFLYLGVGGTVVARPRGWHLRLENMPLRIVAGRPLGLDNTGPITPVGDHVGTGAGTPTESGPTPVGAEDSSGASETQVWVDSSGGETLVYDPDARNESAAEEEREREDDHHTEDEAEETSETANPAEAEDEREATGEWGEGGEWDETDDGTEGETPTAPGSGDGEE